MRMYYVMLDVVPSPDNQEEDSIGAYANCFVRADSEKSAVDSASKYMQEQGWDLVSVEEVSLVTRERYIEDETSLEIYDEACQYGISCAIYSWSDEEE